MLLANTAAKVMTGYHPTHKARTFHWRGGDQGIPALAVAMSLDNLQQPSYQVDKLQTDSQNSPTLIIAFCCLGIAAQNSYSLSLEDCGAISEHFVY